MKEVEVILGQMLTSPSRIQDPLVPAAPTENLENRAMARKPYIVSRSASGERPSGADVHPLMAGRV